MFAYEGSVGDVLSTDCSSLLGLHSDTRWKFRTACVISRDSHGRRGGS